MSEATFKVPESLAERIKAIPSTLLTVKGESLQVNKCRVATTIHTYTVPYGKYLILNPGNSNHGIRFVPTQKDGHRAVGLCVLYWKSYVPPSITVARGGQVVDCSKESQPLCSFSVADIRAGNILKPWEEGFLLSQGESIEVVFHGYDIIDPSKTVLEYTVDERTITI